jgi:hypothetical protein
MEKYCTMMYSVGIPTSMDFDKQAAATTTTKTDKKYTKKATHHF